jgi:phosphodiesterase/alkaline phosphatase D-like protein
MGSPQLRWLKPALLTSNATWKVIAIDMPLGLLVSDVNGFEAWTNDITNVVWLTADGYQALLGIRGRAVACWDLRTE